MIMKKSVEIIAHIFFWLIFTAFIIILSQIYLQARPDSALSQHFTYLVSLELIMALILFYITFLGIPVARRNKKNLIILTAVILFLLAFFAFPATRHGLWETLSSLIPHIIVIFLAVVFRKFSDSIRLEKEKQELMLQNTQSELALLKMQISPHFLFNTLNNIDFLISSDVKKASDSISKLGDMLRYMIYDSKAEKIPLSREIEHIEDYIELIRLRTAGTDYLKYSLKGHPGHLKIAPMLFVPLIENAYKHASKKDGENIISILIDIDEKNISFTINNEFENAGKPADKSGKGIGLNLVNRRLELIYPENATFKISKLQNRFIVVLKIKLDEH
jgi:two-component system, LytTR family, sensor kinase